MPRHCGGCVEINRQDIFTIYGFEGSVGDPEIVTESLLKIHEKGNRISYDPGHISWQDVLIPTPFECPEIKKVFEYIGHATAEQLDCGITACDPWSISNGPLEQIFPHTHLGNDQEWACVYWAQVPENSGMLSIFPLGLGMKEIFVKPVAGNFLVFPSFLLHGVRHNASQGKRVSMSFNMKTDL